MDTEELTALLDALPATTTTTTTARLRRRLRFRPQPPLGCRARSPAWIRTRGRRRRARASLDRLEPHLLPRTRPSVRRRGVVAAASSVSRRVSRPRPFRRPVHGLRVGVHAWGPRAPSGSSSSTSESPAFPSSIARPRGARPSRRRPRRPRPATVSGPRLPPTPERAAAGRRSHPRAPPLRHPILLVGFGMGATAALVLAARHPRSSPPSRWWSSRRAGGRVDLPPAPGGRLRDGAPRRSMRAPEIEEGRVSPEATRQGADVPAPLARRPGRGSNEDGSEMEVRLHARRVGASRNAARRDASPATSSISRRANLTLPPFLSRPFARTLVASTRCPLLGAARRSFLDGERVAKDGPPAATISAHAVDVPGAGHRPMEERPRVSRRGVGPARAAEREATGGTRGRDA